MPSHTHQCNGDFVMRMTACALACLPSYVHGLNISFLSKCITSATCRPLLARTVESVQAGWQQHPAFGKVVLGRLLQNMGKALADRAPSNAGAQTHFTRLDNCTEAVLAGSAPYLGGDAPGMHSDASAMTSRVKPALHGKDCDTSF